MKGGAHFAGVSLTQERLSGARQLSLHALSPASWIDVALPLSFAVFVFTYAALHGGERGAWLPSEPVCL